MKDASTGLDHGCQTKGSRVAGACGVVHVADAMIEARVRLAGRVQDQHADALQKGFYGIPGAYTPPPGRKH
jgi:hypothetical protein